MTKQDQILVGIMLVYAIAIGAAGAWFGFTVRWGLYGDPVWIGLALLAGGGFVFLSFRSMAQKPARLLATVSHDCLVLGWPRLWRGLPFLLALPFFMSAYTSAKKAIGGYEWDAAMTVFDATLHGGDAWHLAAPLIASPLAMLVIDSCYSVWMLITWFVVMWQAFSLGQHRARFLISFVLVWILGGTVMAHAFATVGPCYVEAIHGDRTFAPLMALLRHTNETVPIGALATQDYLLTFYRYDTLGVGAGISAMPSMHVSIAVLMALLGWKLSRPAGVAFTAYAAVIMLGSVCLGWHYAADGYVGAAVALMIWWLVGFVLHRVPDTGQPARRRQSHSQAEFRLPVDNQGIDAR